MGRANRGRVLVLKGGNFVIVSVGLAFWAYNSLFGSMIVVYDMKIRSRAFKRDIYE